MIPFLRDPGLPQPPFTPPTSRLRHWLFSLLLLPLSHAAQAQFTQHGNKLVRSDGLLGAILFTSRLRSFSLIAVFLGFMANAFAQTGTSIRYEDKFGVVTLTYNGTVNGKHSYLGADGTKAVWSTALNRWNILYNNDTETLYYSNICTTMNPPNLSVGNWQIGPNSGDAMIDFSGAGTTNTTGCGPACTTPTAYSVTGGGSYCTGGAGVTVSLANSETGVTYQLKKDGNDDGTAVTGTGSAIPFGAKTAAGVYSVVATRSAGCTATMTGSVTVTVNTPPSVSISPTSPTITSGAGVTLTASGATSYTWSNGSTANPLILSNVASTTAFSVTGTTNGCSGTANAAVSVTQAAAPTNSLTVTNISPVVLSAGNCPATVSFDGRGQLFQVIGPAGSNYDQMVSRRSLANYTGLKANLIKTTGTYTIRAMDSTRNLIREFTFQVTGTSCL
jgi:hypothetical protein